MQIIWPMFQFRRSPSMLQLLAIFSSLNSNSKCITLTTELAGQKFAPFGCSLGVKLKRNDGPFVWHLNGEWRERETHSDVRSRELDQLMSANVMLRRSFCLSYEQLLVATRKYGHSWKGQLSF